MKHSWLKRALDGLRWLEFHRSFGVFEPPYLVCQSHQPLQLVWSPVGRRDRLIQSGDVPADRLGTVLAANKLTMYKSALQVETLKCLVSSSPAFRRAIEATVEGGVRASAIHFLNEVYHSLRCNAIERMVGVGCWVADDFQVRSSEMLTVYLVQERTKNAKLDPTASHRVWLETRVWCFGSLWEISVSAVL